MGDRGETKLAKDTPETQPEQIDAEALLTDGNGNTKISAAHYGKLVTVSGLLAAKPSMRIKDMRGERFIDAEISQMLSENPPIPELSPRQRQILESVTRGLSNEEIAKMLGIGLSVEKEHVRATFAKIGAANRSEAVAIALRKHLLKI